MLVSRKIDTVREKTDLKDFEFQNGWKKVYAKVSLERSSSTTLVILSERSFSGIYNDKEINEIMFTRIKTLTFEWK